VIGIQTVRSLKKQYSDGLKILKKEEGKLEKLKNSESVHEVRSSEKRIASMREDLNLIEKKMIGSWIGEVK
jgi:hypothetical protein